MKKINLYLGKIAQHFGYSILPSYKMPYASINLVQTTFSLLFRESKDPVIIVQVGAFDGKHADPLFEILSVDNKHVKAYLIEPQQKAFDRLEELYKNRENINVLQLAICDRNEPVQMYASSDLDPKASLSSEHFSRFGILKNKLISFTVEGITVETFCNRHRIKTIDLLQIDTEGADFQILKCFLEYTSPKIINFENLHLSKKDRTEARELLISKKYDYIEYGYDTFAISQEVISQCLDNISK